MNNASTTDVDREAEVGTFAALQSPRYRRIWFAQIVSMIGNWMQITGRAVLVFEITGSAAALGTVYFFSYIPQLLFSQFGGVWADRFDRRRLLMGMQFLAALGALTIGILADTDTATLVNISAMSFVLGVIQTLMGPAQNALVPSLVERRALASAVSIQSATSNATRIFGPLLAAGIIHVVGVAWLFYINAVSFVVIIFAWAATPVVHVAAKTAQRTLPAIVEGFRVVRRAPDLWVPILMLAVLSGIGLVYQPLGVVFATDDLANGNEDLGSTYFGLLQGALGFGAVVGVLAIAKIAQRRPDDALMYTSIGFSVALVGLGATDVVAVVFVAAVLLGGFHFAQATVAMNLIQHQVRDEHRGRVMGIHMLAFVGIFPITSWIAGTIAEHVGARPTLVGAGVLCLAFSIWSLRWRHHVRIDGPDRDPTEALAAMATVPAEEQ